MEAAVRFCEKSLRLCESSGAELAAAFAKVWHGSAAAMAVAKGVSAEIITRCSASNGAATEWR